MENPIKIGGVETFSTVDFPDKIAAVIFMQGCPWRCPYCHNFALQEITAQDNFIWKKFIEFLQSRKSVLDGVVFSGGEPLMQDGLGRAVTEVKELGFEIGLHTGGYRPKHLQKILPKLDWVGMDIKSPLNKASYQRATGSFVNLADVEESLDILLASGINFECRTTCDPRLLDINDIFEIGKTLSTRGVKKYFLQKYRPTEKDKLTTDSDCDKFFLNNELSAHLRLLFEVFDIRK